MPSPKGIEFFESKIRPVLVTQCYECHSTQSKKLRGDLLLDSKEGMLRGGSNGPSLVPGKSKDSLIIKALRHDGDTKMPSQAKKLDDAVIADFARWIDMGAPDPREGKIAPVKTVDIEKGRTFWAFGPLGKPVPPAVKNQVWARTAVDRFILAKLEANNLTPNQPTSKERLIRRAYFDLHGLPPSPAEVDAFVNDTSPNAYEKLIDRLLAGDHVGERWGRHWLDLVRFAESGGYEFDGDRPNAFHYRDFVIKALNADMPFDEFVRLQIAGDLLHPDDFLPVSATGFLVAGPYPGQTTSKTLELIRYNHLDDMIATLSSSMLGLSIGCARCHNHKYDPIAQEDYYRLIANLSRTDSTNAKADTDIAAYRKAKAAYDLAHEPLVKARDEFEKTEVVKRLHDYFEANKSKTTSPWLILDAVTAKGKSPLVKQPDGSLLASGKAEANDTYTIVAHTTQKGIKALRIEAMTDTSLPKMGPGRGPDGSFLLTGVTLTAAPLHPKAPTPPAPVKLKAGKATVEDAKTPVAAALGTDKKTGWSIAGQVGKNHAVVFEIDGPLGFDNGTILTLTLKFEGNQFPLGRPRIAIALTPSPLDGAAEPQAPAELLLSLKATQGKLAPAQREAQIHWLRKLDSKVDEAYRTVEEHAAPKGSLVDVFAAQGNRGGDVHFLIRGEVEKKREVIKPGFVQVLTAPGDTGDRWLTRAMEKKNAPVEPRIALANWITDVDHGAGHLLARVIVNRLWQHHLGRGIVGTPNDFGAQGDPPTHPELLDFLARELIEGGWKLKPIHKLIMTSAVYMQAGEVIPANMKADPQNRLWWRRPARRLEAEAIRDAILAVAGTLDTKMYGPGSLDGNVARRSVYLKVKRSQMIPFLQIFDIPEGMQSIGERSVTTVPTQSLAFLNSPFVRDAAGKLAARVRPKSPEAITEAIDQAYLTALSRHPTPTERDRMEAFLQRQTESYGKAPQAREMALTDCCQVLLCLNEFIFVD